MRKAWRNFASKAKRLVEGRKIGISYAALWYGLLVAGALWVGLLSVGTVSVMALSTNADMYHMTGLVKLTTWAVFFFGGLVASYKAGYKGWQHGLWTGLFLGLIVVIFMLEIVPTIVNWQDIAFQWFAAAILGTTGGLVGLKILKKKRDRRGYSFKEARKQKFCRLDKGK